MSDVMIHDDAMWGNIGKDLIPSRFFAAYRVEGPWQADDESMWYSFDSEDKSTITIDPEYPNYEGNKYGLTADKEVVKVTIAVNANLKAAHPEANVRVDGKWYDLAHLDNALEFYMDRDHRINIFWGPGLVETFRVINLK